MKLLTLLKLKKIINLILFLCKLLINYYSQILLDNLGDTKTHKEIATDIREAAGKSNIPEHEVIGIVSDFSPNPKNFSF